MGDGHTALHLVAKNNCIQCVNVLLNVNAKVSTPNRKDEASLHVALEHNSCEVVQRLLQQFDAMNSDNAASAIHTRTLLGESTLHYGARKGCMKCIKNILKASAEATARNVDGQTSLHYATRAGHEAAIEQPCNSVNVNDLDHQRQSALHFAAHCGAYNVMMMLLGCNADVNVKDLHMNSPLQVVIEQQHGKVVQLLLERGATVQESELLAAKQLDNESIRRLIDQAREEQTELRTFTMQSATKTSDWQSKLQILDVLGKGSYGEVYKALFQHASVLFILLPINHNTSQYAQVTVAVKTLEYGTSDANMGTIRQAFERECGLLNVRHDNLNSK